MKLEDIPKKQPFQLPNQAHFDSISSKIYAQLEKEEKENLSESNQEAKSVSIHLQQAKKTKKTNSSRFWVRPQFIGIAATFLLLIIALVGIYNYKKDTQSQQIDFSHIPTQQINEFLLDEDISEHELVSFIPQNFSLEKNIIFEESDLNSIDDESLDLMLEEEYL